MKEAFAPNRWDFVPGPSLVSRLANSAGLLQCVINQKDGPVGPRGGGLRIQTREGSAPHAPAECALPFGPSQGVRDQAQQLRLTLAAARLRLVNETVE